MSNENVLAFKRDLLLPNSELKRKIREENKNQRIHATLSLSIVGIVHEQFLEQYPFLMPSPLCAKYVSKSHEVILNDPSSVEITLLDGSKKIFNKEEYSWMYAGAFCTTLTGFPDFIMRADHLGALLPLMGLWLGTQYILEHHPEMYKNKA